MEQHGNDCGSLKGLAEPGENNESPNKGSWDADAAPRHCCAGTGSVGTADNSENRRSERSRVSERRRIVAIRDEAEYNALERTEKLLRGDGDRRYRSR